MSRPSHAYAYTPHADESAGTARTHDVVVVGAGPVGLSCAIDLAQTGVDVVCVDDNTSVSTGSRAICFAKRTLEIFERLGCGQRMLDMGVTWQRGRVFHDEHEVFGFDLQPEGGHRFPAFINLQQYYVEQFLVERVRELERAGATVELRGGNRVVSVEQDASGVRLGVETPSGRHTLNARYVIACDGANSPVRGAMGLGFEGRVFEDNFLIADVKMKAEFPTERWFWFDPPFNRGQSALLHRQPDDVWRIDLQLGPGVDREAEKAPVRVLPRVRAMLGDDVDFDLEWVSVYVFQCRRMQRFRHDRVFFAGDSAHQVSPFGARGANGGVQDADNLCWKLAAVLDGHANDALLDSYDTERIAAADENIAASTRATDFITPKSEASRLFRDATLKLAARAPFARPIINSGRLSRPATYAGKPGHDELSLPAPGRPGAPALDAPLAGDTWLLDTLRGGFVLLLFGDHADVDAPASVRVVRPHGADDTLASRYLAVGVAAAAYLVRPDQHIAARWCRATEADVVYELDRALGRAHADEDVAA